MGRRSDVNAGLAYVGDGNCLGYDWDDRPVPRSLCPLWLSDYVVVDCLDLLVSRGLCSREKRRGEIIFATNPICKLIVDVVSAL